MARSPGPALATRPRDLRPADPVVGERLLRGEFRFRGEAMDAGPGGDPWDRPCPSRAFAADLHGFGWSLDLLSQGEAGARELLRLWLGWRRLFGKPSGFAWTGEALERRVFHLACAAPALLPVASDAEGANLLTELGRQAGQLLGDRGGDPSRELERAVAAALAGAALAEAPGEQLLKKALPPLDKLIPAAVLADGVHATRSPQRGLELLFDLLALDDALSQRGRPSPVEVSRAIDRLGGALRFFTLGDGRLAGFHGGEPAAADRIAAALVLDGSRGAAAKAAPYGGYQRLESRRIRLIADIAAPPQGAWSVGACVQPGAIEIEVDGRRLIVASAWSVQAPLGAEALRAPAGGSCLAFGQGWPGVQPRGLGEAEFAGPLAGGPIGVVAERQESADAYWLDISHDGWRKVLGLDHTRRLFLDLAADEVRGEDVLAPVSRPRDGRPVFYAVRFHLAPQVSAQVAVDGRSALLKPPGAPGWRLRADAADMRLEPSQAFENGQSRQTQALVLGALIQPTEGGRVRWKLSPDQS